jgi:hypothetical protein
MHKLETSFEIQDVSQVAPGTGVIFSPRISGGASRASFGIVCLEEGAESASAQKLIANYDADVKAFALTSATQLYRQVLVSKEELVIRPDPLSFQANSPFEPASPRLFRDDWGKETYLAVRTRTGGTAQLRLSDGILVKRHVQDEMCAFEKWKVQVQSPAGFIDLLTVD